MIKVTDYIVNFISSIGIKHVFGYPGGVITHFMDSLRKNKTITGHCMYHEQGAAFAACGYAQASGLIGVAYSTSGPGATNLITGIANAYCDSIPCLFLTGQVDTYSSSDNLNIRQKGFQEIDIVKMVSPITKMAIKIENPNDVPSILKKAYISAISGRKGPVLIDLPADVQRAMIDVNDSDASSINEEKIYNDIDINKLALMLNASKKPCILIGNGCRNAKKLESLIHLCSKNKIPVVTSMAAFDLLETDCDDYFGFIGTNGKRAANIILYKSDLLISIGSRLDLRQIGLTYKDVSKNKYVICVDIDKNELKMHDSTPFYNYHLDADEFIFLLNKVLNENKKEYSSWLFICSKIKNEVCHVDDNPINNIYHSLSEKIVDDSLITFDVGQTMVMGIQSFVIKKNDKVLISSGFGSMGYSLPAAIGAYYATQKPVFCFNGDGGLQMNIQELQVLKKEHLPIRVFCFNNATLGMIKGFQINNFQNNLYQTTSDSGYSSPCFEKIADAYDMVYLKSDLPDEMLNFIYANEKKPLFIEVPIPDDVILQPSFGNRISVFDQKPYLDDDLIKELLEM